MKKFFATICLLTVSLTPTAFAGSYSLSCSNADGSVQISERGDMARVYGTTYSSRVELAGLEIWNPIEKNEAQVEIISTGKRTVINESFDNTCRETMQRTFTESIKIHDMKTKKDIIEVQVLCENSSVTTAGGADCSSN